MSAQRLLIAGHGDRDTGMVEAGYGLETVRDRLKLLGRQDPTIDHLVDDAIPTEYDQLSHGSPVSPCRGTRIPGSAR